ncbi:MAG: methyltransferase domain-containing protein [Flavobacteriales bacterium]|nr:methyltransferase domain-containing protein [Flavobacteriales bacterium]
MKGLNTNRWNRLRYSLYLPIYDLVASPFRGMRQMSLSWMRASSEARDVLIVGAGTGLDLEFLSGHRIVATDITPGMIRALERRAEGHNMAVEARVMDGQQLEFEDQSFDVVVLHLILAVIPDPVRCLQEVERVLRPGGEVLIMDKFGESGKVGVVRRLLNPITDTLFSAIDRDFNHILEQTRLVKTKEEHLRWIFRRIKLEKRQNR